MYPEKADRRKGTTMPYSKPSPLKSFIDEPIDPIRINGLIGEDRIRTTKMFLLGTVSNRPTHPIDISASADLIQGLPTHVKIKKIVPLKKEDKDLPISMCHLSTGRLPGGLFSKEK